MFAVDYAHAIWRGGIWLNWLNHGNVGMALSVFDSLQSVKSSISNTVFLYMFPFRQSGFRE